MNEHSSKDPFSRVIERWHSRVLAPSGADALLQPTLVQDKQGEVHFYYDNTQLQQILVNGHALLVGGGLYVIGTCTGADDSNNVISVGSDGRTLKNYGANTGVCPGSPFSFECRRLDSRTLEITLSIGPLSRDHKSLSVPMDADPGVIKRFLLANPGYLVGCGSSWSPRSGTGGDYDFIPKPCTIPGAGAVGVARANRADPWCEIAAPGIATIRRTIVGGQHVEVAFVNHPFTRNSEIGFTHDPSIGPLLRAGTVLKLVERVTVTPWGAGPLSPPAPVSGPKFTTGPRPFGVFHDAAGVEWQTEEPTTGDVRWWRVLDPVTVSTVHDPVRGRDHQRTLAGIQPGTAYQAEVIARDDAGRETRVQTPMFATPPAPTPAPIPSPTGGPMKVTITVPAFTREIEVGDTPVTIEAPLRVVITPGSVASPVPPSPTPLPTPDIGTHPRLRAAPFIGYGQVNRWPWIDHEALAKALYEAGLTFTAIEWIPWWKSLTDGVGASSTLGGFVTTTYPTEARHFIETMAKYSISTMVIMRNWNSDAEQRMSDADFRRDLQALQGIAAPPDMLRSGRPVVCVEGVSEPSGGGAHMTWNRIVSTDWYGKGGKTLANRAGEQAGPFTWGDFHWCEDFTEANAKAALNNTDCGPVINPGPTRAARMTRAAINRDVGFLVYDFHSAGIDFEVIAAMGREIQAGGKGTYVWDPNLLGAGAPPPPAGTITDMLPINEVTWLRDPEADAASFAPTAKLTNVSHTPGGVSFTIAGADGWPKGNIDAAEGNMVSFRKIDGKWYGATWEWLGPRTTERRFEPGRHVGWHMANGNTGQSPNERLVRERTPVPGEPVGHMVCSVVRGSQRTVNQRSNIVVVPHP